MAGEHRNAGPSGGPEMVAPGSVLNSAEPRPEPRSSMSPGSTTVVCSEYPPGGKNTLALQFAAVVIAARTAGASSTCSLPGSSRELLRKLPTEIMPDFAASAAYSGGHVGFGFGFPCATSDAVGWGGGWERS